MPQLLVNINQALGKNKCQASKRKTLIACYKQKTMTKIDLRFFVSKLPQMEAVREIFPGLICSYLPIIPVFEKRLNESQQ